MLSLKQNITYTSRQYREKNKAPRISNTFVSETQARHSSWLPAQLTNNGVVNGHSWPIGS